MIYELDNLVNERLLKSGVIFSKATVEEISNILEIYIERMQWFKEKNIKQWRQYLENHPKNEFEDVIKNSNYFILKKDGNIIGGVELSTESKYWEDDITKAYYIYKLVTKVESKGVGNIIFDICKSLAKANGKKYLRLDCLSTNKKLNDIYESYKFKLIKTGYSSYYSYNLREYKINE